MIQSLLLILLGYFFSTDFLLNRERKNLHLAALVLHFHFIDILWLINLLLLQTNVIYYAVNNNETDQQIRIQVWNHIPGVVT